MSESHTATPWRPQRWVLLALTVMLSGRAMTLAFLPRVGGTGAGDPPDAWLMPLVGDAVIGVTAIAIVVLIARGRGLWAWLAIVTWNALGIWDALSAFLVHSSVPWPEFFMVQIFGSSMFFAATAMHVVNLALVSSPGLRDPFLRDDTRSRPSANPVEASPTA